MKDLTVLIVNFNSGEFLSKCLQSVKAIKNEAKIRVIVVDNDSSDESFNLAKSQFPDFEYIKNEKNLGFGKANNQVLKNLKTEYVLLLNPDCILEKGVIKTLLEYVEKNPDTGAITCKIILPDGPVDYTAHRGLPTPWASLLYFFGDKTKYHLTDRDLENPHEVDSIAGAFLLTSKKVLEKSGLFDEKFFLYGEDIDLCVRIKESGFKVIYYPGVSITHYKGVSSGLKKHSQDITRANLETRKRAVDAFYQAMFIFYDKHFKNKYFFLVNWLVYLGIYLRWVIAKFKMTV